MGRQMEPYGVQWNGIDLFLAFFFTVISSTVLSFILAWLGVIDTALLEHFLLAGSQPIALLFFTWLFTSFGRGYRFFRNKLRSFPPGKSLLRIGLWSFGIWVGATVLNILFQILMASLFDVSPEPQSILEFFADYVQGFYVPLYILLLVFLGPFAEEIFFRGALYSYFRQKIGVVGGVLFSSILFSVAHLEIWAMFPTFLAGLGFAFLFENTRTLWAPVVGHIVWNAMGMIMVSIGVLLNGGM